MSFSMKHFMARINWKQVLVYTIAIWFVTYAFETLSYLFHLKTINAARLHGVNAFEKSGVTPGDLSLFLIWKTFAGAIGWLTAFFISLVLSIKRGWFWLNSLLSLAFALMLLRIHLWEYVKTVFYFPGRLASNLSIEFLINGVLLLSIGLLIFFSQAINRFIRGRPKSD